MSAGIRVIIRRKLRRSSPPSLMTHRPEWELKFSKSLAFIGFTSMTYQYSVPREVARKAKLMIPQMPAVTAREPEVTFILRRRV